MKLESRPVAPNRTLKVQETDNSNSEPRIILEELSQRAGDNLEVLVVGRRSAEIAQMYFFVASKLTNLFLFKDPS